MQTEPSETSRPRVEDLVHYGRCLTHYEGDGSLTVQTGVSVPCSFAAGQLAEGSVVLLFHVPLTEVAKIGLQPEIREFSGTTLEGLTLTSQRVSHRTGYLPEIQRKATGGWYALRLDELVAVHSESGPTAGARRHVFGLTNLKLDAKSPRLLLRVPLGQSGLPVPFSLGPVQDYGSAVSRMAALRSVEVTAELGAVTEENISNDALRETVADLTYLLSVARGTKVTWVYHKEMDGAGRVLRETHVAHITKPFSPWPPAIPAAPHPRNQHTTEFVQAAYAHWRARHETYRLKRQVVDAYLDARLETDYLQLRAAKLVVCLEALKEAFLDTPEGRRERDFVEEETFQASCPELVRRMREDLAELVPSLPPCRREGMITEERLASLSRRSLRHVLQSFCKHLELRIAPADLKLIVQCRNSLIHKGDFYCNTATKEQRESLHPKSSPDEEYVFLMRFLDTILLKLLGYDLPAP